MGEASNVLKKLKERALLFDGAVGTLLNARGVPLGYCKDELNLTNPDLVRSIHRDYLRAGADVIETNTWGANLVRLSAFELEEEVREINLRGAELAREEAGTKAFVAGSVGPLGTLIEPYGRLKLADVQKIYREQIEALAEGGVDLLCIETMSSAVETEARSPLPFTAWPRPGRTSWESTARSAPKRPTISCAKKPHRSPMCRSR
jgi:homocysteine S-methyltransferase